MKSLPKLTTARYTTTLPVAGTTVEYRPFLVKEEKALLMAQEGGDTSSAIRTLCSIISACTEDAVQPMELYLPDFECLFIELRKVSIGETVKIGIPCEKCKKVNHIEINLNDLEVVRPEKEVDPTVHLQDGIGIKLRHLKVKDLLKFNTKKMAETMITMLAASIEQIFDKTGGQWLADQTDSKELLEFVESMTHAQRESIEEFLSAAPSMKMKLTFTCEECGHENEREVSGFQDFFN